MRTAETLRATKETKIKASVNIDGKGNYDIKTPFKFFNHMLEQFAYHSSFDISVNAESIDSDSHHLVEDVAIVLGSLIKEALKDKKGIKRYGQVILPMDEALVLSVVDISNRPYSKVDVDLNDEKTSDFETVLLAHFFASLSQNLGATIHIKKLDGTDTHHIIEASFKSFARAIKQAVEIDSCKSDEVPSTKGVL
ncbi:MAG: imidazoleglycerol-phosphate dehydratase HisB [Cyanobacteria bacterium SIG30]|nr:imidazoleglycerol-phosphate dehydratase HisB [Cyanobacteria bacterium SIG30]